MRINFLSEVSFAYTVRMPSYTELREQIRAVLIKGVSADPAAVEDALTRIMAAVDSFEKVAQEELNRFRSTFADLAR